MSDPQFTTPQPRIEPPDGKDDGYAVSMPMPRPTAPDSQAEHRAEDILSRYERQALEEAPTPPATFLAGVLRFPWYLQSLAPWLLCAMAIALSMLAVMLAIWLADTGLALVAYALRLSIFWVIILAMSYLSGCLLAIVEGTANGYDEITDWPAGDWRDYLFSLAYSAGMLVPTALVAVAVYWLIPLETWVLPMAIGILCYPFFLLSAMENGTALRVFSKPILRTYIDLWWGWGIVYSISAGMFGLWTIWFVRAFPDAPFATVVLASPVLAAILFIYSRLLGRLAWWSQHVAAETDDD